MSDIKNVAIIMDGNGRWAKSKLKPRFWGHIKGASVVSSIVECASNIELSSLTLYTFSSENWSRPKSEINLLLKILKKFLKRNFEKIVKENIQFKTIGDISNLEDETKLLIENLTESSKNNTGLKLNFAFSYGSRDEIVDSVNKFIKTNPGKEITKKAIGENLYDCSIPEIDLLIRTGGDQRVSNFLLWQIAYSEMIFVNKGWPEFKDQDLIKIVQDASSVERRFGSLKSNISLGESENLSASNKREII